MFNFKNGIFLLTIICIIATGIGVYLLGGIDQEQLQVWLKQAGIWAPIIYIVLYTVGTILILPSTPLNLSGGAIFGAGWGTLWTSIAAVIAAIVAFAFTRTVGREVMARKLAGRWEAIDAEMRQGGLFYMFAIRLLPIIPYGIVNFAAGLTSIRFRDYLVGTLLGTVPGILPFVMMGSGLQALKSGDVMPLMFALALTGMLVGGATWYRRHRQSPQKALEEIERSRSSNSGEDVK
ncbi:MULTISPECIES: TVP38/TMEM64 family protein [unclassified Coleofasciculus]|uniref:TVP38/TMEM64 family protein n=1 Tax=unclassified Coleofasciculus TaxID=2692782 RepID=UPI00187E6F8D|nr:MULTISPECIES: TVP38/TMEM64 family protein [unclassified Coleofasciculus]MBE9124685.1 TVP38/TMEM64 family protein [Coleofasciculus sp. LEGE 07081]MBE9147012.1 TVP38/TMEM64 family protein [Coleofasciculus sp. LEGE 07092]